MRDINFIISNNSEIPIYEQIKKEIKRSIISDELKDNDALPSIRVLAKDLKISVLTVKKAYDELEQEGFIKTVQGKGSYIIPKNANIIKEEQIKSIEKNITDIINIARITGVTKKEIIDLFNYIYEEEI